jgi:hypothetical protein
MPGDIDRLSRWLPVLAVVPAAVAMLCAPALWNGYPLIHYDSAGYLDLTTDVETPPWRLLAYALVVNLGRLTECLWTVVVFQAVFAASTLYFFVGAFLAGRHDRTYLALVAILAAFTSLPWTESQVMPDAFTGLLPLQIAALAFGRHLGPRGRVILASELVLGCMVHLSNAALAAGLVFVLTAVRPLVRPLGLHHRPRVLLAAISVATGIAATFTLQSAVGRADSEGVRTLQLALLVQDGLLAQHLQETCTGSASPYRICAHVGDLPANADDFLWSPWRSPLWKLGGLNGYGPEADRLIKDIVRSHPREVVVAALSHWVEQLTTVYLGDGLEPKNRPQSPGHFYDAAARYLPHEMNRFLAARQQRPGGIDFRAVNAVETPLAFLCVAGLVVAGVWRWRQRQDGAAGLAATVIVAVIGNALICGVLSAPHGRYQTRIIWTAPAALGLLLVRRREVEKQSE